jgi:NAD(P)H-flavin reductase
MLTAIPKHLLSVISVRNISESTFVMRTERGDFTFRAGQFVNLGFPDGNTTREYSIYSGTDEPWLEFLIREIPGGDLSPRLRELQPGARISIDGPYDEMFTVKKANLHKRHFLIATGTGISPFHSFVKSYPELNYILLHGVRYKSELYDFNDYNRNFHIDCLTIDKGSFQGRVTEYIKVNRPLPDDLVYICGNSSMIYNVTDWLLENGHSPENIFSETFF